MSRMGDAEGPSQVAACIGPRTGLCSGEQALVLMAWPCVVVIGSAARCILLLVLPVVVVAVGMAVMVLVVLMMACVGVF